MAYENTSGMMWSLPRDEKPTGVVVCAPGFGDTIDGLRGSALAVHLPPAGLAVVRVALSAEIADGVVEPFAPSRQEAVIRDAIQQGLEEVDGPCHIVASSLAAPVAAQLGVDGPDRRNGKLVLVTPPFWGPPARTDETRTMWPALIPELRGRGDVHTVARVLGSKRLVVLTDEFCSEVQEMRTRDMLVAACRQPSTYLLLAEDDQVLGPQTRALCEYLPHDFPGENVRTVKDSDHYMLGCQRRHRLAKIIVELLKEHGAADQATGYRGLFMPAN